MVGSFSFLSSLSTSFPRKKPEESFLLFLFADLDSILSSSENRARGEDNSVHTGQSSWILKQESPSPSASSLRRTVTSSRRSRSKPPTRRCRSSSLTTGTGGKVVTTLPTLLLPTFPLAGTSATPKRRSASSGSARTVVIANPGSVVRSTSTRSSRSNSLGIANTHLFPLQSFP